MFLVFLEVITGILILIYVHGFINAWIYPKPVMLHLHQEVRDLMLATQQMKENWSEVTGIMDRVRDRQSDLLANIQTMTRNLCDESRRLPRRGGDLREARLYVDTVDALAVKLVKMREAARRQAEALVEEWALVEDSEVTIVSDDEPVKDAIAVVKKVLKNFLKENRKNINSEKEDMKKNVRGMTDGLKESIVSALNAVVTDQQPSITTEKQESVRELSTKMLGVDASLKRAAIDVSSTKGILDTIDGQLDEIYGKLELDKKAMNKQCRESSAKMTTIMEEVDRQAGVLDETGVALAKVIAGVVPPRDDEVRKKVEEVSEMLHRFATKVEVPMKMLVSNMRFLYESTVCRSKHPSMRNYERGDVPADDKAVKMIEEKVRSLMKDFRMRAIKKQKGLRRPKSVQDLFERQAPQLMRALEMKGKAIPLKMS